LLPAQQRMRNADHHLIGLLILETCTRILCSGGAAKEGSSNGKLWKAVSSLITVTVAAMDMYHASVNYP
jgi:hypothetical protein